MVTLQPPTTSRVMPFLSHDRHPQVQCKLVRGHKGSRAREQDATSKLSQGLGVEVYIPATRLLLLSRNKSLMRVVEPLLCRQHGVPGRVRLGLHHLQVGLPMQAASQRESRPLREFVTIKFISVGQGAAPTWAVAHLGLAHVGHQLSLLLPIVGAEPAPIPAAGPILHIRLRNGGTE